MTNVSPSKEQIASVISLFSSGKFQETLDTIDLLINKYPNESLLFNLRGACFAGLGEHDDAVKDYEKALTINPDYFKAHFNLGGTLQELDKLDLAIKSYERAIKIEPNYAEAHNNLGNVFKDFGKFDEAIKSYERAKAINPSYLEAHYSLGNTFQNLNRLDDAIKCYKEVLTIKPDFAEMHNNLGALLQQHGEIGSAVDHLESALVLKPDFPEAYNNLGNALKDLNQLDKAVRCYEQALTIKADYAEASFNLGNIFQELKQFDKALIQYQKTLDIKLDYAEVHNNLGVTFMELDQLDASVKCFKKALSFDQDYPEAYYNLASSFLAHGEFDNAIIQYEKALTLKPKYAEAHNNLGIAFKELGQLDKAVKSYKSALTIKSDYAEAQNNLGNALKSLGKPYESIKCYKKTLTIKPDYAEAYNNLGITLMELGQLNEAIKSFRKALTINEDYAEVHDNLGIVLNMLGLYDETIKSYEMALAIKPDYAEAYSNLGNLMVDLKRLNDAVDNYDHAFLLKSDIAFNLGNLIHTKMHLCDWNFDSDNITELNTKINNQEKVIDPFSLLSLIDNPKLHKKAAEIYINDKYPKNYDLTEIELYPRHKKIRIGYFSPDFRNHPVGSLTAELYEIHDRNQFEVFAFSFGPNTNDEVNLRIKAGVDHFHDVRSMSHKEVALLSRSFELDIAIDLGGFTQDSRTAIFAMQAAPIQVNYLGYSSTMGADYMNYIIADPTLIPKDKQKYYSEKIAYLPDSFMVNDTKNKVSTREFTRGEVLLPSDGFVFCCFNHHYKITPIVFASWMKILSQVDGSVLWLSDGNETGVSNLKKEAEKNGIDKNRLIFAPRLDLREDHLNRIKLANLFLDTHPYNAHATTSDALQAGLPVLTRIGESFASRVAASLINSVNLPELITPTQEKYEALAINLATDPLRLKTIKEKLSNNLLTSPLYNTPLYASQIESAYLEMYERHQKGLEPDHIYV